MRSHYCGEITSKNLDQEVTICGWIHKRRDHGGVIFLDVRDIKCICPAVIKPANAAYVSIGETLRNEFCVWVCGGLGVIIWSPIFCLIIASLWGYIGLNIYIYI